MLKITSSIFILLLITNCAHDEAKKARKIQGYVQIEEESATRIEYDCPAVARRICKNKNSKCVPVYTSTSTKEECQKVDRQKIERMCNRPDPIFYTNEKECINIKETDNCPDTLTSTFDIKDLYKCPALYKKLCGAICGKRYDVTDVVAAWQLPQGEYAVICGDGSNEDMKNGVAYTSDRGKHGCDTTAEIHVAAGGTRRWCTAGNKTYNGRDLGAYFWCQSKLK